jgi:hypothetical protein
MTGPTACNQVVHKIHAMKARCSRMILTRPMGRITRPHHFLIAGRNQFNKLIVERSINFLVKECILYLLGQNATRVFDFVYEIRKLRYIFNDIEKFAFISGFRRVPFRKRTPREPVIIEQGFPCCKVKKTYADAEFVSLMPRFSRILLT